MTGRAWISSIALASAVLVSSNLFAQSTDGETDTTTAPAVEAIVPSQKGLDAWNGLFKVFSHPRCTNCHVADDYPRWSGPHYGPLPRKHPMNVRRGGDGFGAEGLSCQTCHQESNSQTLHGPPGAHNWHLAPAEMVWWEKSSAEICAQIKDPKRNGERTLDEIASHVRDDKLVAWGWEPGKGREPAPGSAEDTYALIQTWIAENAPCPTQ